MNNFLNKIKNRKFYIFILFFATIIMFPVTTYAVWFVDFESMVANVADLFRELAAGIFYFSALIFDNLLAITLSTSLFNQGFIKEAWTSIRDLANVVFILGMIIVAFSMMINYGNWKKTLIALIVVAFVLNFSLYFSRVIVDAGNITTHIFLKSISQGVVEHKDYFAPAAAFYTNPDTSQFRSVGSFFQKAMSPEGVLGVNSFKLWREKMEDKGKEAELGSYLLLQAVLIIFFLIFAKHFFKAGFMFLGRMIWIVYYMVLSPFFCITAFIPSQENVWKNKWLYPLVQKSFCVVVHIIFLWLSLLILTSNMVGEIGSGSDFYAMLGIFIIKGIFVVKMLEMANKLGNKWCEEGASTLGNIMGAAGKIGGAALKLTPIGSMARTAMGGAARRLGRSEILHAGQSGRAGKVVKWGSDRLALMSMSAQDIKIGKKSYSEDQKKRVDRRKKLADNMSKKTANERSLREIGVANEDGKLDLNKVDKIANRKQQRKLEELRRLEEEIKKAPENSDNRNNMEIRRNKVESELQKKVKAKDVLVKETKPPKKSLLKKVLAAPVTTAAAVVKAPFMASLEAEKIRVEKDQETAKNKIEQNEDIDVEKKERGERQSQAGAEKIKVEEQKDDVVEALELGNIELAEKSLKSLVQSASNHGASDEEGIGKILSEIAGDIKESKDIAMRQEKLEDMKIFEDEDYRAEDASDRGNFTSSLEKLFADNPADQKELVKIRDLLEKDDRWNSGGEMNVVARNKIKNRYQTFKETAGGSSAVQVDMQKVGQKVDRGLKRVVREIHSSIDAEVDFDNSVVEEKLRISGEQTANAAAKNREDTAIGEKIVKKGQEV